MNHIEQFLDDYRNRLSRAVNESEVRAAFQLSIETVWDIQDWGQERGQSDLSRNHVILEFKDKDLFNRSIENAKFKEAYNQLTDKYIPEASNETGEPIEEFIGIAIDGETAALVFFEEDGEPRHTDIVELTEPILSLIYELLKRDSRRPLIPQTFIEDFGPESPLCHDLVRELWDHLNHSLDVAKVPKTTMLFQEWNKLFAQASMMGRIGTERIDEHLRRVGIPTPDEYTRVLFVLHTYNSILLSFLAAELVSTIRDYTDTAGFLLSLINLDDEALTNEIRTQIEQSRFFRDRGIANFSEGTFFSWYLEDAPDTLVNSIRDILVRLSQYSFPTQESYRVRDLIKRVYENLVPEPLRKNIGEYYTPEWLVEFVLDRMGYNDVHILDQKLLDPTCGSGNFLVRAIHRFKQQGQASGHSNEHILRNLLAQIVGFDLSPLAVISARTNYLLAIADLLKEETMLEIPVYLADAVYAPTELENDDEGSRLREYSVGTLMGNIDLKLPDELVQQRDIFELILSQIEEDASREISPSIFFRHLQRDERLREHRNLLAESKPELVDMYVRILCMESLSWNRLWCRIVRNYFASIAVGKFDLIAGNPPWVRWSELPEPYRETIKPTCDSYDIFSSTPFFGGNELDISAIISYSVTDKWLKENGRLGFVITQIHFQAPSSEGFRRFELPDGDKLKVEQVDDWGKAPPWGGKLANKPAVFVWQRGEVPTAYPVRYLRWRKRANRQLGESELWNSVEPHLFTEELAAIPIPPDKRWSILPAELSHIVQNLQGGSPYYKGRKGIVTDLNGAYFVEVIGPGSSSRSLRVRNLSEMGRKPVPPRQPEINRSLLFPLLKGASDFSAFRRNQLTRYVIIPNRRYNRFLSVNSFQGRYSGAYNYFYDVNTKQVPVNGESTGLLEARSTYRTRMRRMGAPFYAIYDIGRYTFAPYKVVWAEQSGTIEAAVFGKQEVPFSGYERAVVPDHKVFFLDLYSEPEAHYVCGMLNSEIVTTFINSFTIKIQVGTLFQQVKIPKFDPNDDNHQALARLSLIAHSNGHNDYIQGRVNEFSKQVIQPQIATGHLP